MLVKNHWFPETTDRDYEIKNLYVVVTRVIRVSCLIHISVERYSWRVYLKDFFLKNVFRCTIDFCRFTRFLCFVNILNSNL